MSFQKPSIGNAPRWGEFSEVGWRKEWAGGRWGTPVSVPCPSLSQCPADTGSSFSLQRPNTLLKIQSWWLRPACVSSHAWEGVNSLQKPLCLLECLLSICVLGRWLLSSVCPMSSASPQSFTLSAGGAVIQPRGSLPLSRWGQRVPAMLSGFTVLTELPDQTHLFKAWANHSPQSAVQSLLFVARSFPCYKVMTAVHDFLAGLSKKWQVGFISQLPDTFTDFSIFFYNWLQWQPPTGTMHIQGTGLCRKGLFVKATSVIALGCHSNCTKTPNLASLQPKVISLWVLPFS